MADSQGRSPGRKSLLIVVRALLAALALGLVGLLVLLWIAWVPLGRAPSGELLQRMQSSPQYGDGKFENPQGLYNRPWDVVFGLKDKSDHASPEEPIPVLRPTFSSPPGRLRLTWLGHSTVLIEIDGARLLTDPVFGPTASPLSSIGPRRWYEPVLPVEELSPVDAVLISHDHYDHLDQPTIARIAHWDTTFIVPLGVAAHLEYWGVPAERIRSVDWWEEVEIAGLTIACTPSRHASGRQVLDMFRTLWASYSIVGPQSRVFFSGDTGYFDDLSTIGEKYGPFDVTMMEVGAYNQAWPDWHIGPEQALLAHQRLRGRVFFPIHWGLFDLALHAWTEPMERVVTAAALAQEPYVTVPPGGQFRIDNLPAPKKWWPDVPHRTAKDDPIIATRNGDPDDRYPAPETVWASQSPPATAP